MCKQETDNEIHTRTSCGLFHTRHLRIVNDVLDRHLAYARQNQNFADMPVKLEEKIREDISEALELLEHKIRQTDSEATRIRLATVKELKP